MNQNLAEVSIQLSGQNKNHNKRPPQESKTQKLMKQSTKTAEKKFAKTAQNIKKALSLKTEDISTEKIGNHILTVNDKDAELFQLITKVPKVASPWCYLLFVLNLILPGIGTIISSGWGKPCSKTQVFVGIFQFSTAYFIIGWVMSLYWGILIVATAWKKRSK